MRMLLLLSRFSRVQLCVTPQMAAHQAPLSLGFPGKNTGMGCHFLLQCTEVKSESEVTQSFPTLSDPMDSSPPGSSVHGIDFPGKSTGVGCHCLLCSMRIRNKNLRNNGKIWFFHTKSILGNMKILFKYKTFQQSGQINQNLQIHKTQFYLYIFLKPVNGEMAPFTIAKIYLHGEIKIISLFPRIYAF